MTNLTNLSPATTYGDLLTFSNNGSGVSNILNNIQDGFGTTTAIQLSIDTLNVNGTLKVNGTTVFSNSQPFVVPSFAADPAFVAGGIYFNTVSHQLKGCNGAAWVVII